MCWVENILESCCFKFFNLKEVVVVSGFAWVMLDSCVQLSCLFSSWGSNFMDHRLTMTVLYTFMFAIEKKNKRDTHTYRNCMWFNTLY